MKRISIQDFKARPSAAVSEAEAGNTIVVTRHNEAVARLTAAHPEHVHQGKNGGSGSIKPIMRRGTKGRYLASWKTGAIVEVRLGGAPEKAPIVRRHFRISLHVTG